MERQPRPRSDIAEFHLRAGRHEEAARIWADLKAQDPEDVWLYNGAGLSYSEVDDHKRAVAWLGEGIMVAIRTGDPEGVVPQLSRVRRDSLAALGRDLDDVERQAGEYEKAIDRWDSLAEDWGRVAHADYCRRMDGHIKWMRAYGVHVRAVAPIVVDDFVKWRADRDEDPEAARARYAAERYELGYALDWPPARNDSCWCGTGRKYKQCCGASQPAAMHPASGA